MIKPRPGQLQILREGLRCVLANNPSPMTYWGTNTFIVGSGQVAVIDPGPDDPQHQSAILAALKPGEYISHIFVTHSHLDHSPLAKSLSLATGAPIHAFGGPTAGRSKVMQAVANEGLVAGGEGVDLEFSPDIELKDGQRVVGAGWSIQAHWTPGHFGNHMCFSWQDNIFCGDHVMAWASSLVSPPDGDITDFMTSLQKLKALQPQTLFPTHGPDIAEPELRIDWLIAHRIARRDEIIQHLTRAPSTVGELARAMYLDTKKSLLPAAERNVLAHLIDLVQTGHVRALGPMTVDAEFKLN